MINLINILIKLLQITEAYFNFINIGSKKDKGSNEAKGIHGLAC